MRSKYLLASAALALAIIVPLFVAQAQGPRQLTLDVVTNSLRQVGFKAGSSMQFADGYYYRVDTLAVLPGRTPGEFTIRFAATPASP